MSNRTYHNVTIDEVKAVLEPLGFKLISLVGVMELVFAKRVDQDDQQLSLRVFTGINQDGNSRGCGDDAMRVALFWRDSKTGKVVSCGGDKRVNRIQTWKKNLVARLERWQDALPQHTCEKCGSPMILRTSRHGDFLGCASYPTCTATRKV